MRAAVGALLLAGIVVFASVTVFIGSRQRSELVRDYHFNGRLKSEKALDSRGLMHGLARMWDSEGRLTSELMFEHGEIVSRKFYDVAGQVVSLEREGSDYRLEPVKVP